ncbi:MAG: hypothetical protein JSW27_08700 [Phycisphaerales bacterium]|nr:MAG: hypothetical protein JSW27_08700 [Phycisphaerales bacterium]
MPNRDSEQTKDGPTEAGRPARQSSRWRSVIRVTVTALVGFFVVATVQQMFYEPTVPDGTYEWTLRWPGIPPGAKFKTMPGDDCRRLLEILLADASPDWEGPLTRQGTIEVQLSRPAYPSLWTMLKWRFGLLKGPQSFPAERTVLTVHVDRLAQPSVRYEVRRVDRGGKGATRGPFDTFGEAQGAVLDAVAQAMEQIQT